MRIEVIDTGYFYADGGAMFGAIPKTAWSRRYPSDERNGCILAMRSLLIKTDDNRYILVDAGAGDKHLERLSYYRFFDRTDLREELTKRGISPDDITDVILTHLHFDHCGGCTYFAPDNQTIAITFPQARHWVSRRQWENSLHPNPLEKNSYFPENMEAIEQAGLLRLISSDEELCAGLHLRLYDGHTPGQIVPSIQTEEGTFIFPGDVIPLAASISPDWVSAYDTYPVTSYSEKTRLLEDAVNKQQTLLFCHDAYTQQCGVRKIKGIYMKTNRS